MDLDPDSRQAKMLPNLRKISRKFKLKSNNNFINHIGTGMVGTSVADPDPNPDPPDPHVFGPPGSGSGSTSQRYGSGSGSFCHHAKIVRKTLIPTGTIL